MSKEDAAVPRNHLGSIEICFENNQQAMMVMNVLEVDEELNPVRLTRAIEVEGEVMKV